jgi:hypothetical protein
MRWVDKFYSPIFLLFQLRGGPARHSFSDGGSHNACDFVNNFSFMLKIGKKFLSC